jgi:hypothetical protein
MLSRFSDYAILCENVYIYISRNMIFNEAELIRNISVEGFFQNITALINTITINIFAENKENESIAARIRKTIFKIIFKAELSKEINSKIMEITKISAKFISVIIPRRDPNIVYENLIKKNLILSKIIIIKTISNEDKPSYETAIINLKIFK